MGRITFTADEQHEDIIDDVEDEDTVESRSGAVRECISRYADLQQRAEELQNTVDDLQQKADRADDLEEENQRLSARVDELETEVDRVKNEKRQVLQQREEKKELARYVEHERTHQQRWRQAGLATRLRWRITGMPEADS